MCRYVARPPIATERLGSWRTGALVPAPTRLSPSRYYNWPELMRRVFEVDVLECPDCASSIPEVNHQTEAGGEPPWETYACGE